MPNIQFNAKDDLYFKHRQLEAEQKKNVNDKLRKTLERELKKLQQSDS